MRRARQIIARTMTGQMPGSARSRPEHPREPGADAGSYQRDADEVRGEQNHRANQAAAERRGSIQSV